MQIKAPSYYSIELTLEMLVINFAYLTITFIKLKFIKNQSYICIAKIKNIFQKY